jgi:hypothetical protein
MYNILKLAAFTATFSMALADQVAIGGVLDPLHREIQPDADAAHHPLKPVKLTVTNRVGSPAHAVVITNSGLPSIGHSQIVHSSAHWTIPKFSAGRVVLGKTQM